MTAPTYRLFPHYGPTGGRFLRRTWAVTDGYTPRVLLSGRQLTRWGATRAAANAAATCRPWGSWLADQLAEVVERLHADGIDVVVRVDERCWVCVRPCCEVSTRDEVRVLREFLALTADVAWEVA